MLDRQMGARVEQVAMPSCWERLPEAGSYSKICGWFANTEQLNLEL